MVRSPKLLAILRRYYTNVADKAAVLAELASLLQCSGREEDAALIQAAADGRATDQFIVRHAGLVKETEGVNIAPSLTTLLDRLCDEVSGIEHPATEGAEFDLAKSEGANTSDLEQRKAEAEPVFIVPCPSCNHNNTTKSGTGTIQCAGCNMVVMFGPPAEAGNATDD